MLTGCARLPFRRTSRCLSHALVAATLLAFGGAAIAEARCIPSAEQKMAPPAPARATLPATGLHLANTAPPAKIPNGVTELTYLSHSSFLIRTHKNATAITDYYDSVGTSFVPDIITMNHAHDTHYTNSPPAGVKHVLRGWIQNGVIPRHDVRVRDLRVTNVPTNIRDGMRGSTGIAGNSVFIFESAGLCIIHLGHLHHRMKPGHAARLGIVDVLLAPIDDSWTIPHATLVKVIDDLKPVVVIPMHYGFGTTLPRFLALMKERKFAIRQLDSRVVRFSKATLPRQQTVVVMQGSGF